MSANPTTWDEGSEWLEADGLGGFASGTVGGVRTRRYHALLLASARPPTDRFVVVNGLDAFIEHDGRQDAISAQRYAPGVISPDGGSRLVDFTSHPWPQWTFQLGSGVQVRQELFVVKGAALTVMRWQLSQPMTAKLSVRLFLSGRDYHSLQRENSAFRFVPEHGPGRLQWHPYPGIPSLLVLTNGTYEHRPDWYRSFQYQEEQRRGLDCLEDLAAPGVLSWHLEDEPALLLLSARGLGQGEWIPPQESVGAIVKRVEAAERRRRRGLVGLQRAADAYFVRRGQGQTIVAGYPWFTDWGRDTFISLRGLAIASGRLNETRDILLEWAGTVSAGMLPNRFPDGGNEPEYNSVDASLWYIVAVHEYLQALGQNGRKLPKASRQRLIDAIDAILTGYSQGTRFGIRADSDGLLAAGVPGMQLTWMDAKVGDRVITPRIGKPVEVQALWINALRIGATLSDRWTGMYSAFQSFQQRFWFDGGGYLYDVVDVDHKAGAVDASFRPNQIFAIGGLPFPLLEGGRARQVVDAVEARLWTPLGLRSLAPTEPGYVGHYQGSIAERDSAYHQGTAWPWLLGAFVEAWLRVRGNTADARQEAARRFLAPLQSHLDRCGIGHVSEIADGDPPHIPGGCPFQAWSLGELLRLHALLTPSL
ncbi:MAG TPA: amylo-alpha-1,6-glucosidase [Terriglobales bacterium]|nr:amylo-alpha-1,6-glucosidase [Terriglobales bacterium]